jgi:hypothetical protein
VFDVVLGGVILLVFATAVLLGVMPINLEIRGGKVLRVYVRYLCFCREIVTARQKNRKPIHWRFVSANFTRMIKACTFFTRPPLRAERFRLKVVFSSGDAAETAMLYGLLCMFFSTLYPRLDGCNPEILLSPCFSSRSSLFVDSDIAISLPAAVFTFRTSRILRKIVALKLVSTLH